jgi:uncharacterized protein
MSSPQIGVPVRLSVATLGARDVKKLSDFYAGLGWRLLVHSEDFVVFETQGALLALFAFQELASDACAKSNSPETGLRGFTLAINVASREQVDLTVAKFVRAEAASPKSRWTRRSSTDGLHILPIRKITTGKSYTSEAEAMLVTQFTVSLKRGS